MCCITWFESSIARRLPRRNWIRCLGAALLKLNAETLPANRREIGLRSRRQRADGHLPEKTRELFSLAVALMIQCAYCLDAHTRATKKAGVSAEELAEVTPVSAAVQAGATMAHGTFALRLSERRPRTPLGDLASVAAL